MIKEETKTTVFGEVVLISDLPSVQSITDTEITIAYYRNLDAEGFKKIYKTAKPILPDQPDGWEYSPWCSGSFKYKVITYAFELFLGGRGILECPDGRKGLFDFEYLS